MQQSSRLIRRAKRLARIYTERGIQRERPTVGVSASREEVNPLCAVTETGETSVLECGGPFTGEVAIRFLEHLQAQFGEKLVVLLNKATYFTATAVKNFVADEPIELVYFPTGLPDLNPTGGYHRRLEQAPETATLGRSMRFDQRSGQHPTQSCYLECINISVCGCTAAGS